MVKYFLNSLTLLNNAPVINIESYLYSYAKYVVLKSVAYGCYSANIFGVSMFGSTRMLLQNILGMFDKVF